MYEFKLPDVGEGISEAELIEWRVEVGQQVDEDDVVAFVATDKVNVELPSPRAGRIVAIHWEEGAVVPVGESLVTIDDGDGEDPDRTAHSSAVVSSSEDDSELGSVVDSPQAPNGGRTATVGATDSRSKSRTRPIVAAPSTRRFAAELGVNLDEVEGTGPAGRILREDVERASPAAVSSTVTDDMSAATTFEALRGVRAVAARRMADSAQQTATATSTFEVDADQLLAVLGDAHPRAEAAGVRLTPLALIAKCVAAALNEHPRFNATITSEADGLELHRRVDLGVAVASPEGLVVPVIEGVNDHSLLEFAGALADVSQRAREGRLSVAELRGGSFTLSSTGGMERARIVSTTPVINLPHVATLWISRIIERPRVRDGQVEAGPVITASLSFDHRFIDGAEATAFINRVSELWEHPIGGLV